MQPNPRRRRRVAVKGASMCFAMFVVAALVASSPANGADEVLVEDGVLDCRDPIGFGVPLREFQSVGRAIALQTAKTGPALGVSQFDDPDTPGFGYFAKTGLYVRSGNRHATITVPRFERGRIALSWGN